ncbi:MAG: DsbA family oxidoreductase [Myxococcota bacterium]
MSHLDVWSDFACPWCFLGKRRLERALAQRPDDVVEVRWRAFLLRPDLPPEGVDPRRELSRRFGGEDRLRAMFERLRDLGREEGIEFDLDRMHGPHMGLAHEIAAVGQDMARGRADIVSKLVDSLFSAHFEAGVFLGRVDDVVDFLRTQALVLDVDHLALRVRRGDGKVQVQRDLEQAHSLGINGVPLFLRENGLALSGAQPPATFAAYLGATV